MRRRLGRGLTAVLVVGALVGATVVLCRAYAHRARELDGARAYNAGLAAKLGRLRQDCRMLKALGVALRHDPVCIERRMRQTFGVIRPGEKTYAPVKVTFKRAESPPPAAGGRSRLCQLLSPTRGDSQGDRSLLLTAVFGLMGVMLLTITAKANDKAGKG